MSRLRGEDSQRSGTLVPRFRPSMLGHASNEPFPWLRMALWSLGRKASNIGPNFVGGRPTSDEEHRPDRERSDSDETRCCKAHRPGEERASVGPTDEGAACAGLSADGRSTQTASARPCLGSLRTAPARSHTESAAWRLPPPHPPAFLCAHALAFPGVPQASLSAAPRPRT